MTKRDLAGIARQALLSFPGAALGAMLPSEQEAVIKIMTHLQEEAYQGGFDNGYRQRLLEDETSAGRKIMPNLTWTRERPTEPGWYWWRTTSQERIVQVTQMPSGSFWFFVPDVSLSVESSVGQWAGPITQPEEPK